MIKEIQILKQGYPYGIVAPGMLKWSREYPVRHEEFYFSDGQHASYTLTEIKGLGMPKVNVNTSDAGSFDGGIYIDSKLAARNITFDVTFPAYVGNNRLGDSALIQEIMTELLVPGNPLTLYVVYSSSKNLDLYGTYDRLVYTDCYVETAEYDHYSTNSNDPPVIHVSLIAPDPYFYHTVTKVTSNNAEVVHTGGPVQVYEVHDDIQVSITKDRKFEKAYFKVTFNQIFDINGIHLSVGQNDATYVFNPSIASFDLQYSTYGNRFGAFTVDPNPRHKFLSENVPNLSDIIIGECTVVNDSYDPIKGEGSWQVRSVAKAPNMSINGYTDIHGFKEGDTIHFYILGEYANTAYSHQPFVTTVEIISVDGVAIP